MATVIRKSALFFKGPLISDQSLVNSLRYELPLQGTIQKGVLYVVMGATSERVKMSSQAGLRVLIAEDDPHQRSALVAWLSELQPNWRIVATPGSVDEVLAALEEHAPDLSLIDLHLPGANSTDWAKTIDPRLPVIFVTGDPDFAVHAFDSAAIDYVLKPVTMRRLKIALDRASKDTRVARYNVSQGTGEGAASAGQSLKWITMSRGNEVLLVPPQEVIYLEADLKYTRVVSERGEGLVRTGLNELCDKLGDDQFVKIHRSVVLNLRYVASVRRSELGHLEVHLVGRKEVLRVSKTFQAVFRTY